MCSIIRDRIFLDLLVFFIRPYGGTIYIHAGRVRACGPESAIFEKQHSRHWWNRKDGKFQEQHFHPFVKFICFPNLFFFRRSYFLCTANEVYYFDKGENVYFCSVKFKAEVRRIFEERRTGHILATIPQSRGRPLPLGTEAWYIDWGSRNRSILDWAQKCMWAENRLFVSSYRYSMKVAVSRG